jgi:hypothetical protein
VKFSPLSGDQVELAGPPLGVQFGVDQVNRAEVWLVEVPRDWIAVP